MPPRKPPNKVRVTISIDPTRPFTRLKDIESQLQQEVENTEEYMDSVDEEEMGEEEDYYDESVSDIELSKDIGQIDLSFPETTGEFSKHFPCYPPTYYKVLPKQRLLLLFAENFRKQFVINNPKRRPLVLALPNECNVQKFVCTTIRPTAFVHIPLIGSAEGCASFVADFITYEPLEDVIRFPTRLVSPATLLCRRSGNSFEMATLLCSMLIGTGFPAMVVSGVARIDTVMNDQRNRPYPFEIVEDKEEETSQEQEQTGKKYKLRPMPDLKSHLEENLLAMKRQREEEELLVREELRRKQKEELELMAVDRYHYRRSHAWVVIIDNAPWSVKPRNTYIDEDGEIVEVEPKARFIETSTGFFCDTHCIEYILIDSVWDHNNYYVNKQKYQRVGDIRWDLRNTQDWEHLLPGEPPEMRMHLLASDENFDENEFTIKEEKHLDTIRSWVMKPHIGLLEFEQRFKDLGKTVHYKRAIHERYSPYSQRNGKVMQLTLFSDDEYKVPTLRYEYFENRHDLLHYIKYTYEGNKYEERFRKIRNDSLKYAEYTDDPDLPRYFRFFSKSRRDSLNNVELYRDKIILHYNDRSDKCYYQAFEFASAKQTLKKIVEKFHRNTDVPLNQDVAERTFLLMNNKILLKFCYERGALTASTREFIKPPKPDYGKEIAYDPNLTSAYKANVAEPDPTPLELYRLLLIQLVQETKAKRDFENIMDEINNLIDKRRQEMLEPYLKFSIFDPLRNGAARALRLKESEEEEQYKIELAKKPADFLAPYLVPFKGKLLTYDESAAIYNACLNDLKTRFVSLLSDLQRQYEDLTMEDKSLRRFLNKFENQFNNFDYDRLMQEAKAIGLNKRMVQQRLTLTHEASQTKYETVKESLLKDVRLNLDVAKILQPKEQK